MTSSPCTILAESGEAFGEFRSQKSAFAWLIRQGLEFEPLRIVSVTSLTSGGWTIRPKPLRELERPSLSLAQ